MKPIDAASHMDHNDCLPVYVVKRLLTPPVFYKQINTNAVDNGKNKYHNQGMSQSMEPTPEIYTFNLTISLKTTVKLKNFSWKFNLAYNINLVKSNSCFFFFLKFPFWWKLIPAKESSFAK